MSRTGLPDVVARFIADHIDSVEQMEVLLLLRREPHRRWDADAVGRELRIAAASAGDRLRDLAGRGLLEGAQDGYRYAPESPSLGDAVDQLDAAYGERRVSVINHIFSRPSERISTFADAFTLRRI